MKFVDQGFPGLSIHCPLCRQKLTAEWWKAVLSKAFDGEGFTDLIVVVPCCQNPVSLDDLVYDPLVGFARYGLEARSPNVYDERAREILSELEKVLDAPLRRIWARY